MVRPSQASKLRPATPEHVLSASGTACSLRTAGIESRYPLRLGVSLQSPGVRSTPPRDFATLGIFSDQRGPITF
ncbi:MAG: hypothetical protein IPK60_25695 [Sandaracinaceae bacterium]|nr:hypothetical protein [Sandaracinaceae bacterium]